MKQVDAMRCCACAALFGALGLSYVAGCGSKSNLLIGRNTAVALPQAGASNGGAGASGGAESGSGGLAGTPDLPEAGPVDCGADAPPSVNNLVHRYSFEGSGWIAKDSVGTADGELLDIGAGGVPTGAGTGAVLDGNGQLVLDGNVGYVNLPNGLISGLTEVTIVTWAKWTGGAGFERIFDFGVGAGEDDTSNQGKSYLALIPTGLTGTRLQILAKGPSIGEVKVVSTADVKSVQHQLAVVFVSSSRTELYSDGVQVASGTVAFPLSAINDVNDWIGRSQWVNDHTFNGTIDEFRIYDRALTACEIEQLDALGPNTP
jgi:hypothetical protein